MLRLLVPLLCSLSVACSTARAGGFRFSGEGTQAAFESWQRQATPETRAVIAALAQDDTVLIHILRGRIWNRSTRGAASGLASSKRMRSQCPFHPASTGIDPGRNWDVVYDEELQKESEQRYRLPSPVEALLEHEIMGHLVPAMFDPDFNTLTDRQKEDRAVVQENKYRKRAGLPLVPRGVSQE